MLNRYTTFFLATLVWLIGGTLWAQPSGRVTSNLVALYPFTEGQGSIVHDVSGYSSALDLSIANTSNTSWISGGGLSINSSTVVKSSSSGHKIASACISSDELTIEAWVKPANTSQSGPARIVTLSSNTAYRNFTMGQSGNDYNLRVRTGTNNSNGTSNSLSGGSPSTSSVQHLVMTVENGIQKMYVNGAMVASNTNSGFFDHWDQTYFFALANELSSGRTWLGDIYLVGVYSQALSSAEVNQNYQAGYNAAGSGPLPVTTASCNWNEGFSGLSNWATSDNGATAWSTTYGGSGYYGVYNGTLYAENLQSEAVWSSEIVDISSSSSAYISLKAQSGGDLESADYLKFYYSVDGGAQVLFATRTDNFNSDLPETITVNNISGSTLQVIVKSYVSWSGEYFMVDDVQINCGSSTNAINPPSSPNCTGQALHWEGSVTVNGTSVSSSPRLKSGTTQYTIFNGNLPSQFNSAVEVSLDEVISWDGYNSRDGVNQSNERFKVVFFKNGTEVWSSSYTADLDDNVKSAEWKGSLGSATLPNGADKIMLVHHADGTYGDGGSAHSVVPVSVCISYDVPACDNLTSGGQITGDESLCGAYDPAPMTSVSLPAGGTGAIEYVWIYAHEPILPNASNATMIANSNSETYDPGTITQTTYFRRCARRANCTVYMGESNDIVKEVLTPPTATVSTTNGSCAGANGSITFTFPDNADYSTIEFSMDGGSSYPMSVSDNSGSATFNSVANGSYDLYVRWGDGTCETSLGNVAIIAGANDLTLNISNSSVDQNILRSFEPLDILGTATCTPEPTRLLYLSGLMDNILGTNSIDRKYWSVTPGGSFVMYANGTAELNVEISNVQDPSYKFDVVVTASDYSNTPPSQSPKVQNLGCLGYTDTTNFEYYRTFSGTLTGKGPLAGAVVNIDRKGPSWQQGFEANVKSEAYGVSAWLNILGGTQPSGGGSLNFSNSTTNDFNFEMVPVINDIKVCGNTELTADIVSGGGNGATYSWTGPNGFASTQRSVLVSETGTYYLTVNKNGCSKDADIKVNVLTEPDVAVSHLDASCGLDNGSITFTFNDESSRTNIEFSKDNGQSYPLYVADNVGSATFENLPAGTYELWVRWGNNECPVYLGAKTIKATENDLTLAISSSSNNPSIKQKYDLVNMKSGANCWNNPDRGLYLKTMMDNILSGGDQKFWAFSPGATMVEYADGTGRIQGEVYNVVDGQFKFDVDVTVSDYATTAPVNSPKLSNQNCLAYQDLDNWTYYETLEGTFTGKGTLAGASFTIARTGPAFQMGFQGDLASEAFGASTWFTVSNGVQPTNTNYVLDFNNNGSDFNYLLEPVSESLPNCGPVTLTANVLTGYTNAATFSWTGPNGFSSTDQSVVATESGDYTVTVTKNGCVKTETVSVSIDNETAPEAEVSLVHPDCGESNGKISFVFDDVSSRSHIKFSIDGGLNYTKVEDNSGIYTFDSLGEGVYDIFIKWGNDQCEVSKGYFELDCSKACAIDIDLAGTELDCNGGTLSPIVSTTPANGLTYKYYEPGELSALPDFSTLSPKTVGTTSTVNVDMKEQGDLYALEFTGYIEIPTNGDYMFYTNSDDGSKMYLDGVELIDNDGLHGMVEKSSAWQNLTAGRYPVRVTFFERYGGDNIIFSWKGPGIAKEEVPASALYVEENLDVNYLWTGPNGFTASTKDAQVTEAGTYKLVVTDNTSGCEVEAYAVVDEVNGGSSDPGEIGPDQYLCGAPFYPDSILSIRDASGANPEYRWLVTEDPNAPLSNWWVKQGATDPYMPFGGKISKSCWLIRQVKDCDGEWISSNIAAVVVSHTPKPYITVSYDPTTCPSSGPVKVTFEGKAWGSRSIDYTWSFPGADNPSGNVLPNANVNDTRALKVEVFYSTAGTYSASLNINNNKNPGAPTCDSTLTISVTIDDCNTCDNILDPGTIYGSQASCSAPYTPLEIGGPAASGGSGGTIDYYWIYTQNPNLPPPLWQVVPGAVGDDKEYINPGDYLGDLSSTTYFIRCSKRTFCDAHLESNMIVIEIDPTVRQKCTAFDVSTTTTSIKLPGLDHGSTTDEYIWYGGEGKLTTYADGSAKLEGLLENKDNINLKFYANVVLNPVMDFHQWKNDTSARAGQYVNAASGDANIHTTWDYYTINTDESYLSGFAYYGGDTLYPSSAGLTQVGVEANGENGMYGIYSNFDFTSYSGNFSGNATYANEFDDCIDVCPGAPKVSAKLMLNGAYNLTAGEMVPNLGPYRFLARQQPFGVWGYNGTEEIPTNVYDTHPVMNDVVTWVLIELRKKDNILTLVSRRAGLLLKDGSVVGTDLTSLVEMSVDPDNEYYIGARTLGYFGVLTQVPTAKLGRVLTVDFTKAANVHQVYNATTYPAMFELGSGSGVYGLIEGDAFGEGNVDGPDIQMILTNYNKTGQLATDLDLNGTTDGLDMQRALINLWKRTNMLDWTEEVADPDDPYTDGGVPAREDD
ncbi:MAG: LamG-like jellyroll fold domain-containing protein [Bacteroidota bacterium]